MADPVNPNVALGNMRNKLEGLKSEQESATITNTKSMREYAKLVKEVSDTQKKVNTELQRTLGLNKQEAAFITSAINQKIQKQKQAHDQFMHLTDEAMGKTKTQKQVEIDNINKSIDQYKKMGAAVLKIDKEIFDTRMKALNAEKRALETLAKLPDEIARHFQNMRGAIGKAIGGMSLAKDLAGQAGIDIPGINILLQGMKGGQSGGWQGAIAGTALGVWEETMKTKQIGGGALAGFKKSALTGQGAFGSTGGWSDIYSTLKGIGTTNLGAYGIKPEETQDMMKSFSDMGIKPTVQNLDDMNNMFFSLTKTMNVSSGTFNKIGGMIKKDFGQGLQSVNAYWGRLNQLAKESGMPLETVANDLAGLTEQFRDTGISMNAMSDMFNNLGNSGLSYNRKIANIGAMYGGITGASLGKAAYYSQYLGQGYNMSPEAAAMKVKYMGLEGGDIDKIMAGTSKDLGVDWTGLKSGKGTEEEALSAAFKLSQMTGIEGARIIEQLPQLKGKMKAGEGIDTNEKILDNAKSQLTELGNIRDLISKASDNTYKVRIETMGLLSPADEEKELQDMVKKGEKDAAKARKRGRASKHSGGMIFHSGGEVPAILQSGEFVMQKSAVDRIGSGNLESMNSGGSSGNVNVYVNIPILKELISSAVTRVLKDNPHILMFR